MDMTDPQQALLTTVEASETVSRLVPLKFAVSQLRCGFDRVTIIDPDTDVILFEESSGGTK